MPTPRKYPVTDEITDAIARNYPRYNSFRKTCIAIGLTEDHYSSICYHYRKLGDQNPYARKSAAQRYHERTGETVLEAIEQLSSRHTMREVSEMLGFNTPSALGYFIFHKTGGRIPFKGTRTPVRKPVTVEQADEYLRIRESGQNSRRAAEMVGRSRACLHRVAKEAFPDRVAAMARRGPIRTKRA